MKPTRKSPERSLLATMTNEPFQPGFTLVTGDAQPARGGSQFTRSRYFPVVVSIRIFSP